MEGQRLDVYVSETEKITRSAAQKLIESGLVTVNGAVKPKNYKLSAGDEIEVDFPEPVPCEALPEDIPIDVVYEDSELIVVNKPKGMVVHPAAGNYTGTLVNALLYRCKDGLSGINGVIRPGIVHRIDKDTAGLLVVAKNDAAHLSLASQIKERKADRAYHAIVIGNLREDEGTINKPIGRHPSDRKKDGGGAGRQRGDHALQGASSLQRIHLYRGKAGNGKDTPDKSAFFLYRSPSYGRHRLRRRRHSL